jgi:hypothetical protein
MLDHLGCTNISSVKHCLQARKKPEAYLKECSIKFNLYQQHICPHSKGNSITPSLNAQKMGSRAFPLPKYRVSFPRCYSISLLHRRREMEIVFSGAIDAIWPAAIFAISHFTNIRKAARLRRASAIKHVFWHLGQFGGCARRWLGLRVIYSRIMERRPQSTSPAALSLSLILRGSQHPGC